jgi:hypothetical protein
LTGVDNSLFSGGEDRNFVESQQKKTQRQNLNSLELDKLVNQEIQNLDKNRLGDGK